MLSRDEQRLEHILEYCKDIAQTTERFGNEYVAFHADKAYHDLICFYLLQIGELSGQLSEELRSASDEIPWNDINKGLSDVLVSIGTILRAEVEERCGIELGEDHVVGGIGDRCH